MKLQLLLEQLKNSTGQKVAVAQAADSEVLLAVKNAREHNLAGFMLFGPKEEIQHLALEVKLDLSDPSISIHNCESPKTAALEAVKAVHDGKASVVMKGHVSTKDLLKAILNKEFGLRTGRVLSHVALFEIPGRDKLVFLTDAAMNIAPTLEEKAQIISNSVDVAKSVGLMNPKVAPIAAVEVVNPSMPATLDAAALSQMQKRGQIKDCIVDGPLAFDNAVSLDAAEQKGIHSEVAGVADILVVPTIEVGNALYKSFMYFANAKVAAVISGAKAPIVLTSRADSAESKLYSLALSLLSAKGN